MSYAIEFSARAKKQGEKLPRQIRERIIKAVSRLAVHPTPPQSHKLESSPYYRLHVGEYRVIYEVLGDKLRVLVIRIGHRKDIYRSR